MTEDRYYGAKIPKTQYEDILKFLRKERIMRHFFKNGNITEFTRSALRFSIASYYLFPERVNQKLNEVYVREKFHKNTIKLHRELIDEIEELFVKKRVIRDKYNNSKNKFVKYSLLDHVAYWLPLCDQYLLNKPS